MLTLPSGYIHITQNGEYEVVDVFAKNKNILNFVGRAAAVVIRKVLGSLLRR